MIVYRHYDNAKLYTILELPLDMKTKKPVEVVGFKNPIFYQSVETGKIFVREREDFFGTVNYKNNLVPRFLELSHEVLGMNYG